MINLVEFINSFLSLINSHSNDFIIDDLWNFFIPTNIKVELESFSDPIVILERFNEYKLSSCFSCSFNDEMSHFTNINDFNWSLNNKNSPNWSFFDNNLDNFLKTCAYFSNINDFIDGKTLYEGEFPFSYSMSKKKSYEIMKLSLLISDICERREIDTVVDIGSGKGYLGSDLSIIRGLNVIELDCRHSNSVGAQKRRNRYKKQIPSIKRKNNIETNVTEGDYRSIVRLITSSDTISVILDEEDSIVNRGAKNVLTGLHCCGGLSSTILKNFVSCENSLAMVNVGCCYHLLNEQHAGDSDGGNVCDFPLSNRLKKMGIFLGRNGRDLANQSVKRLTEKRELSESIFHRIMLQKLMKDNIGEVSEDWVVGNISKKMKNSFDFSEYVRQAGVKLGLNVLLDMSLENIRSYEVEINALKHRFSCFFYLKCCFAEIIENIIVWDRLQYLRESGIKDSKVIELFDEMKSPRRFVIVALK